MTRLLLLLLLTLSELRLSAALPHADDFSSGADSVVASVRLARLRENVVIGGQIDGSGGTVAVGTSAVAATPSIASVAPISALPSQTTFAPIEPLQAPQPSVQLQSASETDNQTAAPAESLADNAVAQSPAPAAPAAPVVAPSSSPVSETSAVPTDAPATAEPAGPAPVEAPAPLTVESPALVTPEVAQASSQAAPAIPSPQPAPSVVASAAAVPGVTLTPPVESSPLVTPEESPAPLPAPAPAPAAPSVPASSVLSSSSGASVVDVPVASVQPSTTLVSLLSSAKTSPVALPPSSTSSEASAVAAPPAGQAAGFAAAPAVSVQSSVASSSSSTAIASSSSTLVSSSSSSSSTAASSSSRPSSSASSRLSSSSAATRTPWSSASSSASSSTSSSALSSTSSSASSSASSSSSSSASSSSSSSAATRVSTTATTSASSSSSRSSTAASASTDRSSSTLSKSSAGASSATSGSSTEKSSTPSTTSSKIIESASKRTTGKSSLELTSSQTSQPEATESAMVETVTTTFTSVVDRTRTTTITTTVVRTKTPSLATSTARPASSSSSSSSKSHSASPAHTSKSEHQPQPQPQPQPQLEPEPTVTTTVITTVINNVTVTKTVVTTITPAAAVATSSSVPTAGADLGVTVITSRSVGGGRTVTITITKTTTLPRTQVPTPVQAPPSYSVIAPPVYATAIPPAPAAPSVVIETRWTTLVTFLTVSEVQTLTTMVGTPQTSGVINTVINTAGPSPQPFNTTLVPTPVGSIQPVSTGAAAIPSGRVLAPSVSMVDNIFVPIGLSSPPSQISSRSDHPVPRLGITNQTSPPQTNKFYGNFYLGNRTAPTWTHPYSVAWAKGSGATGSWGLAVSQTTRDQLVYGPGSPAKYYINPGGLQSIIISATELGSSTSLTMDQLRAFSVNVNLAPRNGTSAVITFPLVQGMGFVTGIFNKGTPFLQSSIFFTKLTYAGIVSGTSTARYQVQLADNTIWLVYLTASSGSRTPALTLVGNKQIVGDSQFTGSLQVAKNPASTTGQTLYDAHAGVYALRGAVQASTNKTVGRYALEWTKGGLVNRTLLMFALPHHQQSFDSATAANVRNTVSLWTTTKGLAYPVIGDVWTMVETNLPFDMGFAPWRGPNQAKVTLSASAKQVITNVAASELNQDFDAQTNLDSMYFSGKALAKYAAMVWATYDVAGNTSVASAGLVKLKNSLARFVNNRQINPLVYDTVWGGAVSSATYKTGDSGADFGNTYYNDHHFHYGYFVYTAAVIGSLDPSWLNQGSNKAWINMLVRDYANPASNDGYFPFSRMFDWYNGHSWAHGLYETYDGKDEESSSEDTFSSYALKMWGRATGDANMEARGNLMLSIQARSLTSYFLMQSNNTIQPSRFIGNKAAGITFENKIDHTTYFGANIEYIEGIHMLPINPSSMLTRAQNFVREEWNAYFSNGRVDSVAGGWRGILYSNLALIDARSSWNFFASSSFDNQYLDGGASRTWYLAMAAGLGGAP